MNSLASACAALVGTAVTAFASSTERAIIAAMKLSEQPNYSWLSLFDESSGSYEIEGKVTPAGVTWVRMPMVASLERQLGRDAETQLEAFFAPGRTGVVRIGAEWKLPAEITPSRERDLVDRPRTMVRGSAAGRFGVVGGPSIGAASFLEDKRGSRALTAPQFGVTHPHEELAVIVSSHVNMETDGEVVSGALTELGAALLLVRSEQSEIEPLASAGTFKLWIKDGVVIKYQVRLEGTLLVGKRKKVNVRMNSITTLRDIGTTRLIVPLEAQEKLAIAL